jgi:CDP-glycerol glycerophosphotransferase
MDSMKRSLSVDLYRALRRAVPHERWAAARDQVPLPLRRTVRRRFSRRAKNLGQISVVIPCFNVEAYLEECLTSVISQSYPHLEIIVVIDGSPDGSAAIARRYARWDRRIRVVEQANAGLGAARNTGVRLATGEFIAFVDSDDTLPRGSYLAMVESLARTGSDFVVGNVQRREGTRTWIPVWAQHVHRFDLMGTSLTDHPEILADVFSWNKLFRRSFFHAAVGGFPEGIRYEDQEPTAKAYSAAKAFDVLSRVVYSWHIRGDGSSITQQKSNPKDLSDRLAVMRAVSDVLSDRAPQHVLEYWQAKSVGLDVRAYYNEVPRTDERFWRLLRDGVRYVADGMDARAWRLVEVHDRVLARLVQSDSRVDVVTALRIRSEQGDGIRIDPELAPPRAIPAYLDALEHALDEADLELSPLDDRITTVLTGLVHDDGAVRVYGMAYVNGIDLDRYESHLHVRLVNGSAKERARPIYPLKVERVRNTAFDELVGNSMVSHEGVGFTAHIDAADLQDHSRSAGYRGPWHLEVSLELGRRRYIAPLLQWERRWTAQQLTVGPVADGRLVLPRFSVDQGLELHLLPARAVAHSASLEERELLLTLVPEGGSPIIGVTVSCAALGLAQTVTPSHEGGAYLVRIPLPPLPPGAPPRRQYSWTIVAGLGETSVPVHYHGGSRGLAIDAPVTGGLRLVLDRAGALQLLDRRIHASVDHVKVAPDAKTITLRGHAQLVGREPLSLGFASGTDIWLASSLDHDVSTGAFTATFETCRERWGRPGVAVQSTGRSLRLLKSPDTTAGSLWVGASPGRVQDVVPEFLRWHDGPDASIRVTVTSRIGAVWVNTRAPLGPTEYGRRAQQQLRTGIPALLKSPLKDAILFSCFGGRHAADSPLEIYRELSRRGFDGEMAWAVADHASITPEGAPTVVMGSAKYYEALHRSRVLVSNNNFPYYYRKHRDQAYVQTWHGTPLKRIGNDVPSASLSLSYRALMQREVHEWDYLLAQSPFAADVLTRAFGYGGPTLELGYPRNDPLARPVAPVVRQRVLEAIGVGPGMDRIVLYAPTWRDNRRTEDRRYAFVNHLDLQELSEALGPSTTILVRGHSNTPGLTRDRSWPNVHDVSDYPDVTELMQVADALVTDYSSVMFDYVVTGKPILFLVPDIAEYGGQTRGFYFDLADVAPGPLLSSTAEVVEALSNVTAVRNQFTEAYAAFRGGFAPRDDGSAAARVVDAIWTPGV